MDVTLPILEEMAHDLSLMDDEDDPAPTNERVIVHTHNDESTNREIPLNASTTSNNALPSRHGVSPPPPIISMAIQAATTQSIQPAEFFKHSKWLQNLPIRTFNTIARKWMRHVDGGANGHVFRYWAHFWKYVEIDTHIW